MYQLTKMIQNCMIILNLEISKKWLILYLVSLEKYMYWYIEFVSKKEES
jgi:hypothetical protein